LGDAAFSQIVLGFLVIITLTTCLFTGAKICCC